jgi:hypothetical protein
MLISEAVTNTIISVAGIAGTVIVGSIGLYFTARSRTSPNRQVLYTKQVELALKIFRTSGTAINLMVLLLPKSKHQDQARGDLSTLVVEFTQLSYEAAILFPVELYTAFKRVSESVMNVRIEYDEGRDITASLNDLQAADTRWALMARSLIGADELSIESLRLHSKKNELNELGSLETEIAILQRVRDKTGSSK